MRRRRRSLETVQERSSGHPSPVTPSSSAFAAHGVAGDHRRRRVRGASHDPRLGFSIRERRRHVEANARLVLLRFHKKTIFAARRRTGGGVTPQFFPQAIARVYFIAFDSRSVAVTPNAEAASRRSFCPCRPSRGGPPRVRQQDRSYERRPVVTDEDLEADDPATVRSLARRSLGQPR